jgi:riboflavin biosynthesis pyrimidine reductase
MRVVEIQPGSRIVEIDPDKSSLEHVALWYPKILGTRFNFVVSATGDLSSSSSKATNLMDRYFLRAIRSVSDLIITTGKTARSENLNSSIFAPLAILTNRPNELEIAATSIKSLNPVIICSSIAYTRAYKNNNVEFLSVTSAGISETVKSIVSILKKTSSLLEVGLSTASGLGAGNVFDEVCLSVTAATSREHAHDIAQEFLNSINVRAELAQLLESDDLYLFRYQVLK